MADELLLGITILSRGRRTNVPKQVREALKLKPTLHKKEKVLWTQEGDDVIVTKGTPQSSFKKTILRVDGTAAVPRHITEALKMKSSLNSEEKMLWLRKGDAIIVRRGTPNSTATD